MKRRADHKRNPFYEFMREVAPGDIIFCFAETRIRAYGLARSYAYEAPKPTEFGTAGRSWDQIGWRVDVQFHEIATVFRPVDWIAQLRPHFPEKYAPLHSIGVSSPSERMVACLFHLSRTLSLFGEWASPSIGRSTLGGSPRVNGAFLSSIGTTCFCSLRCGSDPSHRTVSRSRRQSTKYFLNAAAHPSAPSVDRRGHKRLPVQFSPKNT